MLQYCLNTPSVPVEQLFYTTSTHLTPHAYLWNNSVIPLGEHGLLQYCLNTPSVPVEQLCHTTWRTWLAAILSKHPKRTCGTALLYHFNPLNTPCVPLEQLCHTTWGTWLAAILSKHPKRTRGTALLYHFNPLNTPCVPVEQLCHTTGRTWPVTAARRLPSGPAAGAEAFQGSAHRLQVSGTCSIETEKLRILPALNSIVTPSETIYPSKSKT